MLENVENIWAALPMISGNKMLDSACLKSVPDSNQVTKLIFRSKTLSVIRRQIFLFSLCVIKRIGICNGGIVVTKGYFWYYMKFRQFLIVLMTFYRNKMKTHFLHLKRFLQFAVFFCVWAPILTPILFISYVMWVENKLSANEDK